MSAQKQDRERPAASADEERPAKRAMREYNYTSPWYFIVSEFKDDGAAYIKYTPNETPAARRLIRFLHSNAPAGVDVEDSMAVEDDGEDKRRGSSDSDDDDDDSSDSSAEEAKPGLGVLQILMLIGVSFDKLKAKHWRKRMRSVDEDLRESIRTSGLDAFGTFDVEYESDTLHPSWANNVNGNMRLLDAAECDRPIFKEETAKAKSRRRRAASDDDDD